MSLFKIKPVLIITILMFSLNCVIAQVNSIYLNGNQYVKENNNWFVVDNLSGELFQVNENIISVKLKDGIPPSAFNGLINGLGVTIQRESESGFIHLKIPDNSKFYQIFPHFVNSGFIEIAEINTYGKPATQPNDPYYNLQKHLHNTYPQGYPNFAYIRAQAAWEWIENGSSNPVIVAVIDNGVDITHIDLNIATNLGYDFYGNQGNDPSPISWEQDQASVFDHGTLSAGIIGAKTNNNIGVAGVAGGWGNNTGALIMGLKVAEGFAGWSTNDIADAINYAANNGAKIINMCFVTNFSTQINIALWYAFAYQGCLLTAAAGNFFQEGVLFPANRTSVIAVGGVLANGNALNNYGPEMELTASRDFVFSTVRYKPELLPDLEPSFSSFDGTSATAPQIAGVAALLWSHNPNLLNWDIRRILQQSAKNLGDTGWDPYYGYGVVQADDALSFLYTDVLAEENPPMAPQNIVIDADPGNYPVITWDALAPQWNINHYKVYRSRSDQGKFYFEHLGTVPELLKGSTRSWTDNSYRASEEGEIPGLYYYYRVTAVKNNGLESMMSDEVYAFEEGLWKNNIIVNQFEYELFNNYPNPFNPSTTIKYSLKDDGIVKIVVYDLLGRIVKELINTYKTAGNYEILFDATQLTSGIYFYTMTSNSFSDTKKLLLIK